MSRFASAHAAVAALVLFAACSSGGRAAADPSTARVDPPQMMSRIVPPDIRVPVSASGRPSVRVTMEVMIDETGRPDMTTFKATGMGSGENRDALMRWMSQASFRPARRNGVSIPGLFRMQLEALTVIRRMSARPPASPPPRAMAE